MSIWMRLRNYWKLKMQWKKWSVESSCTYVRSPTFDVTCDLHENSYGESYVPMPVSSDLEDSDWEI